MGWRGSGAGCCVLITASLVATLPPAAARAQSPVALENQLPGDSGWRLTRRAGRGQLEAYASAASVNHGDTVSIQVRADAPHTVTWKLYRMGWYGGAEGRLVASGGPVPVGAQTIPAPAAGTGLVECAWPTTFTIATAATWTSGVHVLAVTRDDGPQAYAIFVVRADERKGAAVLQASFSTYQAYNAWGGRSLYVGPAQEVSYDRPFAEGNGAGQYFRFEHDFVKWAEARGYDLVYVTNLDVDRDPALLLGQRLFLSVGHDEYWTRAAREHLEGAIASGVSAAFFSGNAVFWQIRLEPSRREPARAARTQVCYKAQSARDPLRGTPLETVQFRDPRLAWPENALLGVMYSAWLLVDSAWVVRRADHWLYEGTGVREGDAIPAIVGYETDRSFGNGRAPASLELVAGSPVTNVEGRPDSHEAAVSVAPSGAFVFAAGTIQWAWGLSRAGIADARVQRMTENVFRRAGLEPAPGTRDPAVRVQPLESFAHAVESVTTVAGRAFEEDLLDGPGIVARFRRPTAAAVDPDGNVWVADTGNHAVRIVRNDALRTVITAAGDGMPGEGDGTAARLRLPQGIVIAPDGAVIVADTGNHRLVRIRPSGSRWTVETLAGASGWDGHVDAAGAAARFTGPAGLAFAGADLYVADRQNNAVRRVTPGGAVTTVAGGGPEDLVDGPAASARFRFPSDVAVVPGGLAVLDSGNRVIRRVTLAAELVVSTVAGDPAGGFEDGPAASARFMPTAGLLLDGADLLVADAGNARIRRLAGSEVTTYAGSGALGGADGPGNEALLAVPTGLARLGPGVALVVDQGSSTLRVLGPTGSPPLPAPPPPSPAATVGASGGGGCSTGAGSGGLALLALGALRRRRRPPAPCRAAVIQAGGALRPSAGFRSSSSIVRGQSSLRRRASDRSDRICPPVWQRGQ
jgi:hypothetical protein